MISTMEKKYSLTLDKEFIQYCELNDIKDIEKHAKVVFNKGFSLEKYGSEPRNISAKVIEKIVTTPRPNVVPAPQPKIKPKEEKKDSLYDE